MDTQSAERPAVPPPAEPVADGQTRGHGHVLARPQRRGSLHVPRGWAALPQSVWSGRGFRGFEVCSGRGARCPMVPSPGSVCTRPRGPAARLLPGLDSVHVTGETLIGT